MMSKLTSHDLMNPNNLGISRPGDYVLATNETHSVREFVEKAFRRIGVEIEWRGKGVDEVS